MASLSTWGEAFIPADDIALDGQVHAEAAAPAGTRATAPPNGHSYASRAPSHASCQCLCGFSAGDVAELDAHLLAAFTPADAIGHDGREHVLVPRTEPIPEKAARR